MHIRDGDIPVKRVSNPLVEELEDEKRRRNEKLFLPGIPFSTLSKAVHAGGVSPVIIQLVGLAVKLTGKPVVKLKPNMLAVVGLSEYQVTRGLRALEEEGLVHIKSAPGKRREITLIDKDYEGWLLRTRG